MSMVRAAAGMATIAGLTAAGGAHAAWGAGSTWPRETSDELADLVVGARPFPPAGACWAVAGLLGAAASAVAAEVGVPIPFADRLRPLVRFGSGATAAALLGRGGLGGAVSALRIRPTTDEFRRWDLRFYSPLCLALGAGALVARGS